jgi:hypothetical protein
MPHAIKKATFDPKLKNDLKVRNTTEHPIILNGIYTVDFIKINLLITFKIKLNNTYINWRA